MITNTLHIRSLGLVDYRTSWQAMQQFTNERHAETYDECWLVEHHPVFTQGQNGKPEHIINPGNIPIVQTDRGGQVTYHGPGQLMVYTLIDLRRKKLTIREFVTALESSVIALLQDYHIHAYAKREAPGVYVRSPHQPEAKICSIGLRVRHGCTYHGIAFNLAMELEPFKRINPCGFSQLKMTQLSDYIQIENTLAISGKLVNYLMKNLVYTESFRWPEPESVSQQSINR